MAPQSHPTAPQNHLMAPQNLSMAPTGTPKTTLQLPWVPQSHP